MDSASAAVKMLCQNFHTWLFDLDGTLYYGDSIVTGARDVLEPLRAAGKRIVFVTNNSRHSSEYIAQKLGRMGIKVLPAEIVTATEYTGRYLREQYGNLAIGLAGSLELAASLQNEGHQLCSLEEGTVVDAVVIGLDTAFTYTKLEQMVNAIEKGAILIGTNADRVHPGTDGRKIPETGTLVAAVEAAVGKRAKYIGKPQPHLFRYAMGSCEDEPIKAVMVGDNYDTDIIGGKRAGLYTIWLSGSVLDEDEKRLQDKLAADLIVRDMYELSQYIGGRL